MSKEILILGVFCNMEPEKEKEDKTEKAFRQVAEWKRDKVKGKIVLHFDGSGIVAKAEETKEI